MREARETYYMTYNDLHDWIIKNRITLVIGGTDVQNRYYIFDQYHRFMLKSVEERPENLKQIRMKKEGRA